MEEDIKILEDMRDNIYGAIQFEDDYEVSSLEQKQFDALNLAINHLRKTKLVHSQFIPKSKVREKIEALDDIESEYSKKIIEAPTGLITGVVQYAFKELLQKGDDK